MTRPCPRCGRPAKIGARHCLYCGSLLGPGGDGLSTPLEALGPALAAEPGPDSGEAEWMVMVTPPPGDPEPLVKSVARALDADPYIVRLRLRRGKPFLGAGSLGLPAASAMAVALADLGLAASLFSESMLAGIPDAEAVVTAELREADVRLATRAGDEVELPYPALFLVVQGEVSERTREVVSRDMLLAQMHSSLEHVEQKVRDVSYTRRLRLVVDLYHTLAPGALRLDEDVFRASRGGAPVSARKNLEAFCQELRRRAPGEVFDASFGEKDAVNVVQRRKQRDGIGRRSRDTTVEDNEAEFDAYSQALFLHVLRLRRSPA